MIVAVTGAKGQLGSELCRQLGPSAVGLDLPEFDLTNDRLVEEAFDRFEPDVVINAAAYTQVDNAEHDPERCHRVNCLAVGQLVEVCRERDCQLVQISTDYVFGADEDRDRPYREDDEPGPLNVYGRSKLESEQLAANLAKHLVVRTCGLYSVSPDGPTRGRNFVDSMLILGKNREYLSIVDDQICSPTYVPHLACAILHLLHAGALGLYHVVDCGAISWYEFACEIFRLAKYEVKCIPITSVEYGAAARRPRYSVLDTGKYHALGGPALPLWRVGLTHYFQQLARVSYGIKC